MPEPLQNMEALIKYLDGEMNETEKSGLETQLQNDVLLKEKMESLQVAIASIQQYGTAEKVKSIHSEMMKELSSVRNESKVVPMRKILRYGLAIAASLVIILVGVNLFTTSQMSSDKLYNEAYVDYDASGVRGNNQESTIESLYEAHNYKAAIAQANSNAISQKDSLLVALSYLKDNNISSAINWLNAISIQNPTKQDADFYLALAYLKNKNYNEALNLMQQIHSNPNHVYHNQFSEDYINKVKKLSSK